MGVGLQGKYIEGMRLSERERAALLEQMRKSGMADRRKSPRIVVEGSFSALLTMESPSGSRSHFRVYPWDLSRGGVGFFHRSFVYPGTHCSFTGLTVDHEPFTFAGDVVRCNHVSGSVHAVGVKLAVEIEPERFLGAGCSDAAEAVEDWWSRIAARASAVAKMAREHGDVEALRAAVAALDGLAAAIAPGEEPAAEAGSAAAAAGAGAGAGAQVAATGAAPTPAMAKTA